MLGAHESPQPQIGLWSWEIPHNVPLADNIYIFRKHLSTCILNFLNFLLYVGAGVQLTCRAHDGIVHMAIKRGSHVLLKVLKANIDFSDINKANTDGHSPMQLAMLRDQLYCVEILEAAGACFWPAGYGQISGERGKGIVMEKKFIMGCSL